MQKATLFAPPTAYHWQPDFSRGGTNRRFVGENPPDASFFYTLPPKAESVSLKLIGSDGKEVETLKAANKAGLNRVDWDMTRPGRAGPGGAGQRQRVPAAAGAYKVVLQVDGTEVTQPLEIKNDPTAGPGGVVLEEQKKEVRPEDID